MGIFQSRPEDQDEWGGLPAEPWEPRQPTEVLPPPVDAVGIGGPGALDITVPIQVYIDATGDAPKLEE